MKRKIFVYDTNRELTRNIIMKFAQGISRVRDNWDVKFTQIEKYNKNGLDPSLRSGVDAVATLGILRGTGEMLKEAAKKGIDYYYMDHAYFNPGYGGDNWMRIVKNGHSCTTLKLIDSSRYDRCFSNKNPILNWKTNAERGQTILICPPTHAVSWYMNMKDDWTENTIHYLKRILPMKEHYRIVVRDKPNEPIVDEKGNLVDFKKNKISKSLDEDLNNAHCVIAFNSMVSLTASLRGIPVITSEHNCCFPISYNLDVFKSNPFPQQFEIEPVNRKNLIYWLANNQWNIKEIENGTAWSMLKNYQ